VEVLAAGRLARLAAALAVLLAAGAARAQGPATSSCPVDATRLELPPARPWNTGGGEDPDGCRYAVAADGGRRVVGLDAVVACPRCGVALPVADLGVELTAAERARLEAIPAAVPQSPWPAVRRHEVAAAVYEALGPERLGADPAARAELLLRAAWAARGAAVLAGPDHGYRPRTPAEARRRLAELERRLGRSGGRRPLLEQVLDEVEAIRRVIDAVPSSAPTTDLALERLRARMAALEQDLLVLRSEAAEPAPGAADDPAELHLAVARAAMRFGDPARRERWLEEARARFGEPLEPQLDPIRRAAREEARLLGRAEEALLAAAERVGDPSERSRLLFLAGEAARRVGRDEDARSRYEAARSAAPDGLPAERAGFFLDAR